MKEGQLIPAEPDKHPITPMQMIAMAVEQNADVDKMRQLMDLQERWEKNEAKKAFVEAMTAFKKNPPVILKNKLVSFETAKGNTSYRHAMAGESAEKIGAALAEHGFSHRWETAQLEGGKVRVTCIITHARGHSESTTLEASPDVSGNKNSIQAVGSTVSYLQRYTLFAGSGLVPKDADDDGRLRQVQAIDAAEKEKFVKSIAALATRKEGEALWQSIAAACSKASDTEAYDELKAALHARMDAIDPPQAITPDQAIDIEDRLRELKLDPARLCKVAGVERLSQLRDYQRAISWIEAHKK